MHGKRLLAAVTGLAALAIGSGAASAATMHPTFGAKLAGMGEHGVVNFTSNSGKGQLCWTFDVMTARDHDRVDPRRLGHGRRQARPGVQGEELRDGVEAGARDDRVEARLLQGLGGHEGPYGRAQGYPFRGHGAHVRNVGRSTAMDETHADPQPPKKVGRAVFLGAVVGGVSSLYWGKAVWGKISAQLSPVEASIPLIPSGGWRIYTVSGSHADVRPADLATRPRRPRRQARRRSPTTSSGRSRRSSRSRRSTASPAGR